MAPDLIDKLESEFDLINSKIIKLNRFLSGTRTLSDEMEELLTQQLIHMAGYRHTLGLRINILKKPEVK